MWVQISRVAAAVAVFGAMVAAPASVAALERVPFDLETVRQAQAEGQKFVIGAWAGWCATCQSQIATLTELADDPRFADLTIYHIDYDLQKPMMRLFGIASRSQVLVFQGETELGRLIAVTDPEAIEALLVTLVEAR